MGDKITLKVDERSVQGKKVAKLRQEGLTPGVVYGPGMEPQNIQVEAGELTKVISAAGRHSPVHLTGSKRRIAMIKDADIDPSKNVVRHVSFHAVRADHPVVTEVPIELAGLGESEAEKNGLIILQTLESVQIRALPMELPESLEISVAKLTEEGQKLTLGMATLPEGVEYVEHSDGRTHDEDEEVEQFHVTDQVVASVWEPAALQAANEAAAGDADEDTEVESENGEDEEEPEAPDEKA